MSKEYTKEDFLTVFNIAVESREKVAAKIYDLNTIMVKISELASEGFQIYRIKPDKPLNLKDTKKAKETEAALTKMGFVVGWSMQTFLPTKKENETDQELECMEMIIKWEDIKKRKLL